MSALIRAIEIVSEGNQTAFTRAVNAEVEKINNDAHRIKRKVPTLSQQLLNYYLIKNTDPAAHFVPIISNLTGGIVSKHDLRPDVFSPINEEAPL